MMILKFACRLAFGFLCAVLAPMTISQTFGQEVAPTSVTQPKRTSEIRAEQLKQVRELAVGSSFQARDTLNCGNESSADAQECLHGLVWELSLIHI